ncbi:hypothetical protein [Nakamurella aerolata]|uniref:Cbl-PTB domain-containing protein n=1 Tax=Nakamurella aerolata TaxID=1656892 RepID=A0A849AE26_9ACTN|nr:hypothetical protein [Nakamurella aerolata]NNG36710.1 hypothetical protein [Nakamurella aerolata]
MIITAAIWLAFVAAAVRPPWRRGSLGFAVFVATMSFNEIPAVFLGVFIASMLSSPWPGELHHWLIVALLASATTAGLIWLQVRARTTIRVLDIGLADGLGGQSRGKHHELRRTVRPTEVWVRGLLLPFQRRARHVMRQRNLTYGPDRAHRVDVYARPTTGDARPVLIHLHGGGFVSGRKSRESITGSSQWRV